MKPAQHYTRSLIFLLVCCCLALGSLSGCSSSADEGSAETLPIADSKSTRYSFDYLDTVISITIYNEVTDEIWDNCFDIIASYEERVSRTLDTTEIWQLNTTGSATVEDDIMEMLQTGLYYSELTKGRFDITVQPITSLWDFQAEEPSVPDAEVLAEAVTHVNYENLVLDGNTATLTDPDSGVDLGGIAKGFIADELKEYLVSAGVTSAIINLGGDVLCIGKNPNGNPFYVGIQLPFGSSGEYVARVAVEDLSMVTSGVYERYFVLDDVFYHHILNTSTGYPCDTDLLSVTIISDDGVDGDCLATACFTMNCLEAIEFIDGIDDVYACCITDDLSVYYSDGFEDFLAD